MASFAESNPDATQLQERIERFHAVREGFCNRCAR